MTKIDTALLNRATGALLKHHLNVRTTAEEKSAKKNLLLEDDDGIIVQFGLLRVPTYPSGKTNVKPIRLSIPHPIHSNVDDIEVCFIVKQEDKARIEELVEETFPQYLSNIKLVLGLNDLRTKYGRFAQRRDLLKSYDLFLADDRILPMLRSALGGKFIDKKRFPIPIKLNRMNIMNSESEALPIAVKNSIRATFMYQVRGNSLSVRAGHTGMTQKELVENFEAIVNGVSGKIPRGWANILNISIKTSSSLSLPFYTRRPDELAELEGLLNKSNKIESDNGDSSETSKKRKNSTAEDVDKDSVSKEVSKKEKAAKSPLLRAIKKQKKTEAAKEKNDQNSSVTSRKTMDADENDEVVPMSSKKIKKSKNIDKDTEKLTSKKKLKIKAKSKDTTKKEENEDDFKTPTKKSKDISKAKLTRDSTVKKLNDKEIEKDVSNTAKNFILSKKFKGAKTGFVFKAGPKGNGYYKDEPPLVDKAAMAALQRASARGSRSAKSSSKKRRGRR